jgi:glycosyltransferase involved in cell wall biosynthesis
VDALALEARLMTPLANYLRLWDYASAARVDQFAANSRNVQQRIWKTYRRESEVVYPPVDVDSFYWKPAEDYFLAVSELVPYKRVDSLVRWFSMTGRRLKIAGAGPEYGRLRAMAAANVEFLGRVTDAELRELYARCRAFLLPGEEDFGLTAVEALASGKPVVALGRGGALETVPGFGGVFYDEPAGWRRQSNAWKRSNPPSVRRSCRRGSGNFPRRSFAEKWAPCWGWNRSRKRPMASLGLCGRAK